MNHISTREQFKAQELFEHPPSIKAKLIPVWHREAHGVRPSYEGSA